MWVCSTKIAAVLFIALLPYLSQMLLNGVESTAGSLSVSAGISLSATCDPFFYFLYRTARRLHNKILHWGCSSTVLQIPLTLTALNKLHLTIRLEVCRHLVRQTLVIIYDTMIGCYGHLIIIKLNCHYILQHYINTVAIFSNHENVEEPRDKVNKVPTRENTTIRLQYFTQQCAIKKKKSGHSRRHRSTKARTMLCCSSCIQFPPPLCSLLMTSTTEGNVSSRYQSERATYTAPALWKSGPVSPARSSHEDNHHTNPKSPPSQRCANHTFYWGDKSGLECVLLLLLLLDAECVVQCVGENSWDF